ncbi:MAG: hypothetical protein WB822_19760, partial [Rhodoplanes sp.]
LVLYRRILIPLLCMAAGMAAAEEQSLPGPEAIPHARLVVIGKWRGNWDVKATRLHPKPQLNITYTETFDWILGGRFLRSETSQKSDGGKSMSIFWFDAITKTYRFVIFDAKGFSLELPPPTWDERTQTMEWKTGWLSPTSYTANATFPDPDTIRWRSLWKDWKGSPILELEGVSTRRK